MSKGTMYSRQKAHERQKSAKNKDKERLREAIRECAGPKCAFVIMLMGWMMRETGLEIRRSLQPRNQLRRVFGCTAFQPNYLRTVTMLSP